MCVRAAVGVNVVDIKEEFTLENYISKVSIVRTPNQVTTFNVFIQGVPPKLRFRGTQSPEYFKFSPEDSRILTAFYAQLEREDAETNSIFVKVGGGEPFCAENVNFLLGFVRKVKEIQPTAKIMVSTGFTEPAFRAMASEIYGNTWPRLVYKELLELIDYLVCNPYVAPGQETAKTKIVNLNEGGNL